MIYKTENTQQVMETTQLEDMTWDTKDNITNMVSEFFQLVLDWNGCLCLALAW